MKGKYEIEEASRIPDWKLERYLLGELPKQELEDLRALERSDAELQKRITALRASDAALLEKYPPAWMGRKIEMAANPPKIGECTAPARGWINVLKGAAVLVSIAVILLHIPPEILPQIHANNDADGVRVKGLESRLEVWRQIGKSAEKLTPGDAATEGDLVQLRYLVPEFCYGVIVSLDGRGVLTVHLSGDSGNAAPLTPGKPIALDHSYELDDAPKFETFYLITAPQNFDIDAIMQSALKTNKVDKKVLGRNQQKITIFTLKKDRMVDL